MAKKIAAPVSFEEAKRAREVDIARFRKGSTDDKALADALGSCTKGDRCRLPECKVCELVAKRASRRFNRARQTKAIISDPVYRIYISGIDNSKPNRKLNEKRVHLIAASMRRLGLIHPITVREVGRNKPLVLVAGAHRLASAKELGWDTIRAYVRKYEDKTDDRLWQIFENVARAELTVLERAEQLDELRQLMGRDGKEGQNAPPGGKQPKEQGINKAAKLLGLDKKEVRRCKKIAEISTKAKLEAVRLKLDDDQGVLLEIAAKATAKEQLAAVQEVAARKSAAQDARRSAAEKQKRAELSALRGDIREKKDSIQNLQKGLAASRSRLQTVKDPNYVPDAVGEISSSATLDKGEADKGVITVNIGAKLREKMDKVRSGNRLRLTIRVHASSGGDKFEVERMSVVQQD